MTEPFLSQPKLLVQTCYKICGKKYFLYAIGDEDYKSNPPQKDDKVKKKAWRSAERAQWECKN